MTLSDYSDLEKEIQDAPEPKILARGSEVKARIINVREGISEKNNCQWYQPVFDVPAEPLVLEFNGFLWDLKDRDKLSPKMSARALSDFHK